MFLEASIALLALATALWLRPWRMLASRPGPGGPQDRLASPLVTPLLGVLVLLPWIWALPTLHRMPLQLQWSSALLSPALGWGDALGIAVWQGIVPATLAMLWGAALRRWLPHQIFVYILARGFAGTVLCVFIAALLAQAAGHALPGVNEDLSRIARWLMAWGDAVVTGMVTAIFVVFRPEWLATWSDAIYLRRPPAP
jgi:uncharacterized membrane protein